MENVITIYVIGNVKIATQQRTSDWAAYLERDKRIWEAGYTEAEAIGLLIMHNSDEIEATPPADDTPAGER